jgi:hypothetical protein
MQTLYVSKSKYRLEFTGRLLSKWRETMASDAVEAGTIEIRKARPRVRSASCESTRIMVRQ